MYEQTEERREQSTKETNNVLCNIIWAQLAAAQLLLARNPCIPDGLLGFGCLVVEHLAYLLSGLPLAFVGQMASLLARYRHGPISQTELLL